MKNSLDKGEGNSDAGKPAARSMAEEKMNYRKRQEKWEKVKGKMSGKKREQMKKKSTKTSREQEIEESFQRPKKI